MAKIPQTVGCLILKVSFFVNEMLGFAQTIFVSYPRPSAACNIETQCSWIMFQFLKLYSTK